MNIIASYNSGPDVCCLGGACPGVHLTDDGRVLVQGGIIQSADKAGLNIPRHEDVVILDRAVFEKIARQVLA